METTKVIRDFIERAKRGENVYICNIRDAFASLGTVVKCSVETASGEVRRFAMPIPDVSGTHEKNFVRDYFYSNIYNIISVFGGKHMTLSFSPEDRHIKELCGTLNDVFQVSIRRTDRRGYGKCLNVTDRVNAAGGFKPFYFNIEYAASYICDDCADYSASGYASDKENHADAVSVFRKTVDTANSAVLIGLDIGGTDIKAVSAVNGKIISLKEYDWYPAGMPKASQIIDTIDRIVRELCTELGAPGTHGVPVMPDGIGVGFPDVVIADKIVGGETSKTGEIRAVSPDYEAEFAEFLELNDILLRHCKPGGVVSMTNDGSLAAYTAALELAYSDRFAQTANGVFAHTLGTELGTGWIDENGEIPQIPLELYNCVIDMGNYPGRGFLPDDLRSTLNLNTKIAGTMQKYACQMGAYRLAFEYLKSDDEQYRALFEKGFIEERGSGVFVVLQPEDMRKAFLAHLINLADEGQPQAERIFYEIGKYLAATWRETEFLLMPKVKQRVLYGRFVKSHKCLSLMQEGAQVHDITLTAGDESLAFSPLMKDLRDNPAYTVAQSGQAIGAAHLVAKGLQRR